MIIPISQHLHSSAPEALARLTYHYPELRFAMADGAVEVTGEGLDEDIIRREVNYAFYRQHVFTQSLPLRTALITTLSRP